jgi:hypothetical protein
LDQNIIFPEDMIQEALADGMTIEEIEAEEVSMNQDNLAIGTAIDCLINTNDLVSMFNNWKI